jgi:predicted unusual protein kinase regulating ubiquinone biosynthesis (AarF/ABC1/UbiB family)
MRIAELMDREVPTVGPDATLADAAVALRSRKVSAVVVTDGEQPLGILTERDFVQAVVDGADPATTPARERMTTGLLTLGPEDDADQAGALMVANGFRHVPIVDAGRLVGMITQHQHGQTTAGRRPTSDFGTTGTISGFRGPYADGPPPEALEVVTPPLEQFGVAELRRLVVIYLVLTLNVVRSVAGWVVRRRGRTVVRAACDGAVDGFIQLGPTFVKLGQIIASSSGMFPDPLPAAARRCLDEVPPFGPEQVRAMIREDLGRPPKQIFKEFDDSPLSAASIGQVHACTLPDGRDAVVKLQRPGITGRMTTDLRIMFRLAKTFEKTKFGASSGAANIIRDLHAVTFQELNPAVEAWRQSRFRDAIGAFGDNTMVTAPEVYWDFCGPHMICMERVSGIPMDQFEAMRERGVDGQLVLRRGAKVWAEAVMMHGPFHGDMHAGNIWVLDDGRGCYLDFGIMGELTGEWRDLVKDLFYTCMFDMDFTRVAKAYRSVGIFPPDVGTDEEIGARLGMILGPMLTGGMGSLNLGELITQSLELMKAYDAVSPQELVLIAKQLLYIERYTKGLAADYQLVGDPFLMKNIFPDEAAKKAAELGVGFPD